MLRLIIDTALLALVIFSYTQAQGIIDTAEHAYTAHAERLARATTGAR